ncbi:MAG: glycoside hydrolase family 2 [Oscillospiraceae bacterium]|nr:glycoside hydrolase family 2 [Oscillospiraceae bacterium]
MKNKKENFADLYTPEGENLSSIPWNSYPRPQMKRDSFFNLNGEWDFYTSESADIDFEKFEEKIIVPFPPQSLLSGIHRNIPEEHYLFYRKNFILPKGFFRGKVILHIGGADQYADVILNGKNIGSHTGGYEHFSFDITETLSEENTLIIRVIDKMSSHILPYGKQSANRGGMWYTPVSGIWQSVWMESVPEKYIESINIKTGADYAEISLSGVSEGKITLKTPEGEIESVLSDGKAMIHFENPEMWSPEEPYLYYFTASAGEDSVESYFALRTLSIEDFGGIKRLCLNGKPYFFHGVLDQGYWSDGIFTPADASCYKKDILAMKSLGFNTIRKHIKIEPEQFYYDCDRLGMVVFQDMVNNGDYNYIRDTVLPTIGIKHRNDKKLHRDINCRRAFAEAMEKTVHQLENHPCICWWTIFNEGWGQFESTENYRKLKSFDETRFIASTSGWFKGGESDVSSEHCYFKSFKPYKSEKPLVLTEFGGYTFAPEGHRFNPENEYGYKKFGRREELSNAIKELYEKDIIPAIEKGLCAAIYTQLSDVEDETNGFLSYDRKIMKVKPEEFLSVSEKIYEKLNLLK